MKPVPWRQARLAHRQRRALGRALHQIREMRVSYWRMWFDKPRHAVTRFKRLAIPRLVRHHERLLRHVLATG